MSETSEQILFCFLNYRRLKNIRKHTKKEIALLGINNRNLLNGFATIYKEPKDMRRNLFRFVQGGWQVNII